MSRKRLIPGQLNFSSEMESLLRSYQENNCQCRMDTDTTQKPEKETYVDLGIRLMTMAKDSLPKYREIPDLQEKIFSLDFSEILSDSWEFNWHGELYPLTRKIAISVIRPIIRQINGFDCDAIKRLKQLTPHHRWNLYTYEELTANEPDRARTLAEKLSIRGLLGKKKIKTGDEVLYFFMENMDAHEIFVGSKMETHPEMRSNSYFTYESRIKVVDFGMLIALLFVIDTIRDRLQTDDFLSSAVYKDYVANIMKSDTGVLKKIENKTFLYMSESLDDHLASLVQASNCRLISVFSEEKELFAFLKERYPEKEQEIMTLHGYSKYDLINKVKDLVRRSSHKDWPVMVTQSQLWVHFVLNVDKLDSSEIHKLFSYSRFYRAEFLGVILPLFDTFSHCATVYDKVLCGLFSAESSLSNKEIERKRKAEREMQGTMARSFETKKNIPKNILAMMESSILNKRFGYIEFDEMCDIEAIDTVSHQILDFVTRYFPNQDLKLISLRFRRLGKSRASGLYYPFYKCLCIDIHSPGSFVHEFGHMLDYENGNLSDLRHKEFKPIYDQYVYQLEETCRQEETLYKKLHSSCKYNISYFKKEKEVFARCFEIFIASYVKLDNSLIKDMEKKTFAYPQEKKFVRKVCDYFLNLPCMAGLKESAPKVKQEKEMIA